MHLILRLKGKRSDRAIAARMREGGLYAEALSGWGFGRGNEASDGASALLVSFTNIESRETAENHGRRILELL